MVQGPVDEAHRHLGAEPGAELAPVAGPVEDVSEHHESGHHELLVHRSPELRVATKFDGDILGEIGPSDRHRVGRAAQELGDVTGERTGVDVDHRSMQRRECGGHELLLGGPAAIQRGRGHTGGGDDRGHREPAVAIRGEDLQCGAQDGVVGGPTPLPSGAGPLRSLIHREWAAGGTGSHRSAPVLGRASSMRGSASSSMVPSSSA